MSKYKNERPVSQPSDHVAIRYPDDFFGNSPGLVTLNVEGEATDQNPIPSLGLDQLINEATAECGRAESDGFFALADIGGKFIPIDSADCTVYWPTRPVLGRRVVHVVPLGRVNIEVAGRGGRRGVLFYMASEHERHIGAMVSYSRFACRAGAELLSAGTLDPNAYVGPPGDYWAVALFFSAAGKYVTAADCGVQVIKEPWAATLRVLRALRGPEGTQASDLVGELRAYAAAHLKGDVRRFIELLCDNRGRATIADLKVKFQWEDVNNCFNSLRRRTNRKLEVPGAPAAHVKRFDNAAHIAPGILPSLRLHRGKKTRKSTK